MHVIPLRNVLRAGQYQCSGHACVGKSRPSQFLTLDRVWFDHLGEKERHGFLHPGDRLATAGADASIKLWSLRDALRQHGREDRRCAGNAGQLTEEDGLQTLAHCPSPSDGSSGEASAGALPTAAMGLPWLLDSDRWAHPGLRRTQH